MCKVAKPTEVQNCVCVEGAGGVLCFSALIFSDYWQVVFIFWKKNFIWFLILTPPGTKIYTPKKRKPSSYLHLRRRECQGATALPFVVFFFSSHQHYAESTDRLFSLYSGLNSLNGELSFLVPIRFLSGDPTVRIPQDQQEQGRLLSPSWGFGDGYKDLNLELLLSQSNPRGGVLAEWNVQGSQLEPTYVLSPSVCLYCLPSLLSLSPNCSHC